LISKSPKSIRAITKHADVRRILGWGPTLEPQLDYIQSQKHDGIVTVSLKKSPTPLKFELLKTASHPLTSNSYFLQQRLSSRALTTLPKKENI
jgi:hypothetical protein